MLGMIISACIIIILIIIYFIFISIYPTYGNKILDNIKYNKNWQWVNPIPSNGNPNIPYIFYIMPNNKMQISYYDHKGMLKGFSSFVLNYTKLDENSLELSYDSTIMNYSKVTPTFPWKLKYIDSKHMSVLISGVSQILELI